MVAAAESAGAERRRPARAATIALGVTLALALSPAPALPAQSGAPCVYTNADGEVVITSDRADPHCRRNAPPGGRWYAGATATTIDLRVAEMVALTHAVAVRHGVDHRLVEALVEVESGFDPGARSARGAVGLMQLMPELARHYGVTDPFDPSQNLEAGVRHLRALLLRYGSDLELALAAYNAGESAVERYGGVPPFAETSEYVRRVLERFRQRVLAGVAAPR